MIFFIFLPFFQIPYIEKVQNQKAWDVLDNMLKPDSMTL